MGKEKFTHSLLDFLLFLDLVFLILSSNTLHPFTLCSSTILRAWHTTYFHEVIYISFTR